MTHDFTTLWNFLASGEVEVSGRGIQPPVGEMREKLERFMAGDCSDAEKEQICEQLRDNPECLKWMAERHKAQKLQESQSE